MQKMRTRSCYHYDRNYSAETSPTKPPVQLPMQKVLLRKALLAQVLLGREEQLGDLMNSQETASQTHIYIIMK